MSKLNSKAAFRYGQSMPLAGADPVHLLGAFLSEISETTAQASYALDNSRKVRFAQYFTPIAVANQMAAMLDLPARAVVGDCGAGTGILGATVLGTTIASDSMQDKAGQYELQAYEIDDLLHHSFRENLSRVNDLAVDLFQPVPTCSLHGDFTRGAPGIFQEAYEPFLDAAILNPPYQKLHQSSDLAKLLRAQAAPTPNLYAAFILLAVQMLRPGGQLVAIVPRSFCNGDYFRPFRLWLKEQGAIDWLVRYQRRSNVFRADNVLQENVIFRFRRGASQPSEIRVSLSDDPDQPPKLDTHVPDRDILPENDDRIYVPATREELAAIDVNRARPCSLADLGLTISTGKIEDFRYRDHLSVEKAEAEAWVPLVYAQHWERGQHKIQWRPAVSGKPACLDVFDENLGRRLAPAGHYVVLKRISANDDRTGRCHPAWITPDCLPGRRWAFENHVQVIGPAIGKSLPPALAEGLALFLASREVDLVLKTISGTTQLNCNDIRRLRFPSKADLVAIKNGEGKGEHGAASAAL
ncbi:hypothetical protein EZI54_06930 [Marinobacter halodurans]|uniref:site-specific DNA-methyltransferase (adenine-specific) n=1 Tax=Marinobacter halodurans TaxID=2528979 RepID=A0ABY1ZM49_9GAMM|nr:Eco57I restriction-modification methylase domain-containing protein [Marinobacter halodurans]TBW57385.1 hypothetical protein EZI54_06930 [Marinobacter halodurans]